LLPELNQLANDWAWLIRLDQFTLLAISPFGDLFMKDITGAFCLLDINLGALEYAEVVGNDPALLFPIAFDDRIAGGYREAGLHLTEGKCYGYKKQCVAGGSVEVENVYVATTAEYISFMGDFHFQIKDVEDGESVYLKVTQ
jgi:type VI secretion system (T6SS) immunity protein Tdi1